MTTFSPAPVRAAVIDTSVLMAVLLPDDSEELGDALARWNLQSPSLIDAECANVLRRFNRRGFIGSGAASNAFDRLIEFPIIRHEYQPLLPRMWELRHNVSTYDAAFLTLSERFDLPLLTRDLRLARAAESIVEVIVL
jgi:predicted nucleic acid-binding protein